MTPRVEAYRLRFALLIPFALALAWNVQFYYPFISDDALISLRYSSRLLEGHGLTWTAGHPVEGYSNLLWVLLVAGLGLTGLDLVFVARFLGFLAVTTTLGIVLFSSVRPRHLADDWFPATVGLLFVSLSAPMAVWAIGGLEQPLVGVLLAATVPLVVSLLDSGPDRVARRRLVYALSVVLGLLAVTRPDGPLFTVAAFAALLVSGSERFIERLKVALNVLVIPSAFYLGHLLFRFFYYGELVPNTALVKLTPTAIRRTDGLDYLVGGLSALAPFSYLALGALVGLLAVPRLRGKAVYLLAICVLWSTYVVVIGGDIFPAYRHMVPLIVVFAFALTDAFGVAVRFLKGRSWATAALVVLTLAQLAMFAQGQRDHKQSRRAVTERWEWECKELGVFLKTVFTAQQPLLAVTAAGCLPYWSELPALDMLGLNDYYLPRHPPPDFGTGFLGHELGDGAYVLRSKPDLIVFSVGTEPSFRSGLELATMAEFHERYVPVTVRVEGVQTNPIIYFDRYSPKIGIRKSSSSILVPGFLFRSERTVARLNRSGTLVSVLSQDGPLRVNFAGEWQPDWQIEVVSSRPGAVTAKVAYEAGRVTMTLDTKPGTEEVEVESVLVTPGGRVGR